MKKANRSSKIINFKDFNTGYNAVSEREDNIIGQKIADFRAANKMSLTDLRILLEIHGISITNASISKWETGASVPNIYQFIAVMQALGIDENISFFTRAAAQLNPEGLRKLREYRDDLIATGKYRVVARHSYEEECIDMPISTLSVSAGTGTFLDEGNFETISFSPILSPYGGFVIIYPYFFLVEKSKKFLFSIVIQSVNPAFLTLFLSSTPSEP